MAPHSNCLKGDNLPVIPYIAICAALIQYLVIDKDFDCYCMADGKQGFLMSLFCSLTHPTGSKEKRFRQNSPVFECEIKEKKP